MTHYTQQNDLNLGSFQMSRSAATKTFAILAQRGAGKSYTGGVLAEEFAGAGIPFVVFDPIDVWWGLRLAADSKGPGLPVVVFGKAHADVPLTADMGVDIAHAVVEQNVSCVLSTFGMPKAQQRKLITDFSETLLNTNRTPRHIIIEEAHEFVPQRIGSDMTRCFNAVNSLVVMGRNRGLGVTLISQRAATINKDSLTQIDTLLAFRNTSPQDRKALREWVDYHGGTLGDFRAFIESLPALPTGEGWLWSPQFLGKFERIKIRQRRTFHPDPEKLDAGLAMPTLAAADVQAFIGQFDASPLSPPNPAPITGLGATKRAAHLIIDARREAAEEESKVGELMQQLQQKATEIQELRQQNYDQAREIEGLKTKLSAIQEILVDVKLPPASSEEAAPAQATKPAARSLTARINQDILRLWVGKLGGEKNGAARMLQLLADKYPMTFTRHQLALAIGMSADGGAFSRYMASLLRVKLVSSDDGYVILSDDLIEK